ncbi:MAG: phosphatidate cytidylyltransferase [Desulfovermiculus sp.]
MSITSHQQRLLTAGVLILLLAGLIFAAPPVVQAFALAGVCLAALLEFWTMFWPDWRWIKGLGLALALPVVLGPGLGWTLGGTLLAGFWLLGLVFVLWARQREMPWTDVAVALAGLVYIPGSLHFLCFFSQVELLVVLLAAAASDTGAFYGGSRWGKRKMCPSISPKKTWMGSLCGLGACVLVSMVLGLIWGHGPWYVWFGVGVALNVAAQGGDLFESALKRELEIKDSGGLLPGHGGILDRVDSLLLVIPVYMAIRSMYPFWG